MLASKQSSRCRPRPGYLARVLNAAIAVAVAAAVAGLVGLASPPPALASPAASAAASAGPSVHASGADLVNAATGKWMWSKDLNVERPMGSITKVMAALVVLKAGGLSRQITVTSAAVRYAREDGASSAGLIAGDRLTARQLLEAMLVPSGCDAAYLLATAYGPGRGAFIKKMNAMAKSLGLTRTHFSSFDGMPFPTEYSTYSTPGNLVRLGEVAMRNATFRGIALQRRYVLAATHLHHRYAWKTTNGLLGSYAGAVGIKTGNTKAAGYCLLFEARRGGRTLIGVVLHADPGTSLASAFTAARQMLNWGFAHS
ncbi:MAG TPA: serine hydrolase [Streptosporangiaceae bacterium]|nr:serine hydrolase [Streptosporangiaceae bacterium]